MDEQEVLTPIQVDAEIKQYTLVGDDIYVKRYDNDTIPDWYRNLISDIIYNDATIIDHAAAIAYLESLETGYNISISNLVNKDTVIDSVLESLRTTNGDLSAAIASLDITKVDADSAQAISRDTVASYFVDGSAAAWFNNEISTYASAINSHASSIGTLSVVLDNQEVRIDTIDTLTISQGTAISTIIDVDIPALQNQIDGSITTWFQSVVPTLTNYPAVDWTTDTIKNEHLGDIYYDKVTGYAYRFAHEDIPDDIPDMGLIYTWIRVIDTDITAALEAASTAQDTADGKSTVYYQTTAPVGLDLTDKGDVWVNSTTNAISTWSGSAWVLSVANPTAAVLATLATLQETDDGVINSFYQTTAPTVGMSYGDWWVDTDAVPKLAYRYEDVNGKNLLAMSWVSKPNDIVAKAFISADTATTNAALAQADADAAQATADSAVASAATALTKISDFASDNILSPIEKPSVIQDKYVIDNEKAGIEAQAIAYGIVTEKNTYLTAITTLTTYLSQQTSPVLWSVLTDNTNIVGTTFRTNFENVYIARQALLNKIAEQAKALADTAQLTADGKIKVWYQTAAPTGLTLADTGDIWIDTDDNNVAYVWSSTGWNATSTASAETALEWSASASKLITSPDGYVSGWEFGDGSNINPYFNVFADTFKMIDAIGNYAKMTSDGLAFYKVGAAEPFKMVAKIQSGVATNNTTVTLTGFYKTPLVFVSQNEVMSYHASYAAQSQKWQIRPENLSGSLVTGIWTFTAVARLLIYANSTSAALPYLYTGSTNDVYSTSYVSPANTTSINCSGSINSYRTTGTTGSYQNRQCTVTIQTSPDNATWTDRVSQTVQHGSDLSSDLYNLTTPTLTSGVYYYRLLFQFADAAGTFTTAIGYDYFTREVTNGTFSISLNKPSNTTYVQQDYVLSYALVAGEQLLSGTLSYTKALTAPVNDNVYSLDANQFCILQHLIGGGWNVDAQYKTPTTATIWSLVTGVATGAVSFACNYTTATLRAVAAAGTQPLNAFHWTCSVTVPKLTLQTRIPQAASVTPTNKVESMNASFVLSSSTVLDSTGVLNYLAISY